MGYVCYNRRIKGVVFNYVEINFNKIFYQPEKLEAIQDILADLAQLENELKTLETDLSL